MKQELLVILSVLATFALLEIIFTGFRKPGETPGYLGLGRVCAGYIVVKMTVVYAAHSDVRRDEPLYKNKRLSPPMWVVERIVSTPATHSSHHGKRAADGVTNYKGNYGNPLFLWDVLFGTARITRRYPKEYGVENLPATSVAEQLFWSLVRQGRGGTVKLAPAE